MINIINSKNSSRELTSDLFTLDAKQNRNRTKPLNLNYLYITVYSPHCDSLILHVHGGYSVPRVTQLIHQLLLTPGIERVSRRSE